MNFRVGQKVVCVDAGKYTAYLTNGEVYTVSALVMAGEPEQLCLQLVGVAESFAPYHGFLATRFRPAVSQFDFHKLVEPQSLEKFKREDEQSQPRRQKKVTQI